MKCVVIVLWLLVSVLPAADGWMEGDSARVQKSWKKLPAGLEASATWQAGKLATVRFKGAPLQNGATLFSLLDSLNGNGSWNEIDAAGVLESSLQSKIKGARQSWLSWSPGQKAVLVCLRGKPGELQAEALPAFKIAVPVPLEYRFTGGLEPFADFERYSAGGRCGVGDPCNLIHREDENLQAVVEGRHVRMGYRHPDVQPLEFPVGFSTYSEQDKAHVIREYQDYFRNELSVMLRAFVHSTPGLFNWQSWQWPSFSAKGFISVQELRALFMSGHAPGLYQVLQLQCKGGERIRFETDGNGAYYMEIQ